MNILETSYIDELFSEVGKEITLEIINTFIEEAKDLKEKIVNFDKNQDIYELERLAHTLKSTAATFGAIKLSNTAKQIEKEAREEKTVCSKTKIIGQEMQEVLPKIDEYLKTK